MRLRAPQKFWSGLVLVCLSLFVFWAVRDLNQGTLTSMGPAMFPRMLAYLIGGSGLLLIALSFFVEGPPLPTWGLRGPALITASILLFAVTIRPFGLAIAGMLALFVSGLATPEARVRELAIFSAALTIACVVLFRYLLEMSVPVLVIPGTGIRF